MAAIANLYYRTRGLPAAPFLARPETNASRTATVINNGGPQTVINMADLLHEHDGKPNKDTLFGPSIGVVNSGPDWADKKHTESATDDLTPEIVKGWVAKSKEASEPTTTLQALVNLKRPTIRLSPLAAAAPDSPDDDSHHLHGLEFEFDCDADQCGISVHVIGVSIPAGDDSAAADHITVFETVVPGGFGRKLKLEEGAALDLGRFEHAAHEAAISGADEHLDASSTDDVATRFGTNAHAQSSHRKRLTFFRRRAEAHNRPAAGPALALVDAETATSPTATNAGGKDGKDKADAEGGLKVTIRLVALDDQGKELASLNEQVTYLHVVRLGAKPPLPAESGEPVEDIRPWVVKVVKREATIGSHTFHLHEIYGLTSHSSAPTHPTAPTAPTIDESHTYPPTEPLAFTADAHEDDPTSECLLCLSAPREVVLLPCRHLVACRECAVNMIEFGAGGTLVHADSEGPSGEVEPAPAAGGAGENVGGIDTAAAASAGATEVANGDATPNVPVPAPAPAPAPVPPPVQTRRKRKAKGWFCPVCRQPYTSLLRITTTAPPPKEKQISPHDKRVSTDSSSGDSPTSPTAGAVAGETAGAQSPPSSGRTGLNIARPGFLRHFSRGSARAAAPPDLERGRT